MKIGKRFNLVFAFMLSGLIWGCGGSGGTTSVPFEETSASTVDASVYAESVAEIADTYDVEDIVDDVTFDESIDIDFTANTAGLASASIQDISEAETTLLTVGSGRVTIVKTAFGLTVRSTVDAAIAYNLSGTLAGTSTVVSSSSSPYPYQIQLSGVDISATAGPALDLESTQKVYIVTAPGTANALSDSATRSMTMKAALYGKGPMVFSGDGLLSITGRYKHGVFSNDYIRVCSGTLDVAVGARDAVRSVNGFIFDDGDLTIHATGATVDEESKGIKVEGSEKTGTGKGYIVINGGYIDITSVGKAITASWDIDEDASTETTADDPDPYVVVNNGVLTLTTTGTPYEYESDGATVSCSPEGIEGKTALTINNGYLEINTTDDCLNAGNSISIHNGYLYCRSSKNDAIDSNGTISITGGVTVAIGSNNPEGSFDCDHNEFIITGGTIAGIGGNISPPTPSPGGQNIMVLGSMPEGSRMALRRDDGLFLMVFEIPQPCETMILSSPGIKTGGVHTVHTEGAVSADHVFHGLYLGNITYTGGRSGTGFIVSNQVTELGGVMF